MLIIDVPFAPTRPGAWSVAVGRRRNLDFATRQSAVEFAAAEAERLKRTERTNVVINIEGADGVWRAFRNTLESVV
ncbi:hypothetical protein [Dyella sp.]|uniref:hypothetical protein n=1 Tax=Dyella sp. TaxID=1869338 RepID=UPI002ED53E6D